MQDKLCITFKATESQKEAIKAFCRNELGSDAIISVSQAINNDFELSISMFEYRPEIYIGIMSTKEKNILEDAVISDEDLELALEGLAYKYAFATTRSDPIADERLVVRWINYRNSKKQKTFIQL